MANRDEPKSAVLRSAATVVSSVLRRHGFSLAAPVESPLSLERARQQRYRRDRQAARSARARAPRRALLRERFGDAGVDHFEVV